MYLYFATSLLISAGIDSVSLVGDLWTFRDEKRMMRRAQISFFGYTQRLLLGRHEVSTSRRAPTVRAREEERAKKACLSRVCEAQWTFYYAN